MIVKEFCIIYLTTKGYLKKVFEEQASKREEEKEKNLYEKLKKKYEKH
jgi:hypothetical protein